MVERVITDTKFFFTRQDGRTLNMGEGEAFKVYSVKGLGIGELDRKTTGSALQDGELWLGSRIMNRSMEIRTEWLDANQRAAFVDFFQHNTRLNLRLLFNGSNYYASCVLEEPYEMEEHEGNLYDTSGIVLYLYFDDPYFYSDTSYRYAIGARVEPNFRFYTTETAYRHHEDAVNIRYFGILGEPQEYRVFNPNSTPNGIEARISTNGMVVNPSIINLTTGRHIQIRTTMLPGDEIYINTQSGLVAVTKNGKDAKRDLSFQSHMIQVVPGENILFFNADSGAQVGICEISFRAKAVAL
ncbi:MAG: phage tail family protein [Desulfovibrionaceae bacterium]|nr:phage tail family protein [Desulfovibrionaceae bacterium]